VVTRKKSARAESSWKRRRSSGKSVSRLAEFSR